MMGQQQMNNRIAAGGMPVWNQGTSYAGGGGNFYSPSSAQYGNTGIVPASKIYPGNTGIVPPGVAGNTGIVPQPRLQGGGGSWGGGYHTAQDLANYRADQNRQEAYNQLAQIQPNTPLGFQYAGAPIAGQMASNTTVGMPGTTTGNSMRYMPYQFYDPGANFAQRTPYQFTDPGRVNVADLYTPQMDIARRDLNEQSQKSQEQQLADLNSRGANKAIQLNLQDRDRKLADLSSQYSIEQGRMQLQEDQLYRQMDQQRQLNQAEEIFRQMGATDAQAQFLASQNVNLQNAQAGQNLSAFGQNLPGLLNCLVPLSSPQQQGQQFNQALQGRQQATAEEQLANLFRRQPLEDLMKMWMQQSGQIGATEGSAGIMGVLGPIMGAAAGAFI